MRLAVVKALPLFTAVAVLLGLEAVIPATVSEATQTTVPTTTQPFGPQPRGSRRIATDIDTEKIRPVSLPVQTMVIAAVASLAGLSLCGFVYGKVRSRVPAPAVAKAPKTGATAPPTTFPPPDPDSASEWAPPPPTTP